MTTPHLSTFLKPTARNLESLKAAWARMLELGYADRRVEEPDGCTRTRCAGPHDGFPGSEHRWALTCRLCGTDIDAYYSHMRGRTGTSPKPPTRHRGCPYAGKRNAADRAARYAELSIPLPAWDIDARTAAKEATSTTHGTAQDPEAPRMITTSQEGPRT
ncbi:hypothetical protein AB0G73_14185 [Streptomyces sp. NPDC020719]|uniref:hypothetical protein n=1 Tax=Streptomyces sp. NPDC020719 TaxID=3154896 RepID=UPI0033DEE9F0